MRLKKILNDLIHAVVEEAERNPGFRQKVEEALGHETPVLRIKPTRAAHRRASAVLDPVELARESESVLRHRLSELNLEQLKDIVADYGMDPGKLVLKWKSASRVIDRIVEVSMGRAKKGEAFLA